MGGETKELSKRAYARISMLTKLRYVRVKREDLIDVYILFVRSLLEYCAVVWHSRLTLKQKHCLERVQKCALRVILGEDYLGYTNAMDACNLKILFERREERCLSFAKRCLKHPVLQR